MPKYVSVSLKGNRGFVDLTFGKTTAHQFHSTIHHLLEPQMIVQQCECGSKEFGRSADARSHSDGLGFQSFSLSQSNFRTWDGDATGDADRLGEQIEMHIDHLSEAGSAEDVLYELLLKAGFSLTTKVKRIEMMGKQVFSIEDGALLICLEKEITPELIDALAEANPLQVICLDEGFKGNDQLKANAVQTFRARAQAEESEIVFRTV